MEAACAFSHQERFWRSRSAAFGYHCDRGYARVRHLSARRHLRDGDASRACSTCSPGVL